MENFHRLSAYEVVSWANTFQDYRLLQGVTGGYIPSIEGCILDLKQYISFAWGIVPPVGQVIIPL